ncbi:hypothetical protein [Streptosporangium saharense]|uniref:hypothetical protein n=1 Tax=Streptosporangium saharense TaxID=1706840 RepID=UPI00331749F9
MSGPEHYREAEKLLAGAMKHRLTEDGDWRGDPARHRIADALVAEAQVHATLALAAATALNNAEGGPDREDWLAWKAAAGEPKGGAQ